jgi:lipopolysaccharide export system permease protein
VLSRLFKKLDILIVKAFIGPFVAIFFITLFVLDLQFFWLYIDDVVGKGIDGFTVGRLILYLSATVVPLALPLAVLLSSIMTLGNLGETFELVAIKSAGISLLRFMRPLAFVSLLLAIVAFFFNNNVLPIATLKLNTIKYDIIYTKPAFDIKEGVFYDRIEGFVIKIGKKEKDDSTIRDVVIYEQTNANQDNVIVADSGKMVVTPDKRSLEFILKSGSRYQEKNNGGPYTSQLVRMSFDTYKKVMDLTSFQMNKTNDSSFKGNFQGMTLPQLGRAIDSIHKRNDNSIAQATRMVNANLKFANWLDTTGWDKIGKDTTPSRFLLTSGYVTDSIHRVWVTARRQRDSIDKADAARDSAAKAAVAKATPAKQPPPSGLGARPPSAGQVTSPPSAGLAASPPTAGQAKTIVHPITPVPGGQAINRIALLKEPPKLTFGDLLPDSVRINVMEHANSALNNARVSVDQPLLQFTNELDNLRQHEIAWHEKITLAVAVLVMFLIGAPLGSIIRKGGIGMPLVFAVVFFIVFFLLNNFGRKFVKEGVMGPIGGMWLATYVLTPIGIFLTYKALHDSNLFSKEFYFRLKRGIVKSYHKLRRRHREESAA